MWIPRIGEWLRRRFRRWSFEKATSGWRSERYPNKRRQNWSVSQEVRQRVTDFRLRRTADGDTRQSSSFRLEEAVTCVVHPTSVTRICVPRPGLKIHFVSPPSVMLPVVSVLYSRALNGYIAAMMTVARDARGAR